MLSMGNEGTLRRLRGREGDAWPKAVLSEVLGSLTGKAVFG